jgi:leucyl/phenylalanyl-tRNA--protein transferase
MESASLTPWTLRLAYQEGIFPMGDDLGRIRFYRVHRRAVFPMETGMHVSRSLARTLRRKPFEVRFDTAFEQVMRACLRPRDNWITEEMIQVYTAVWREGWGHSAECWVDDELVGGVYGVSLGAAFFAESMFHRKTDASKVALHALIEHCRACGYRLFDVQLMNPHLARLGAVEISNRQFLSELEQALRCPNAWRPR